MSVMEKKKSRFLPALLVALIATAVKYILIQVIPLRTFYGPFMVILYHGLLITALLIAALCVYCSAVAKPKLRCNTALLILMPLAFGALDGLLRVELGQFLFEAFVDPELGVVTGPQLMICYLLLDWILMLLASLIVLSTGKDPSFQPASVPYAPAPAAFAPAADAAPAPGAAPAGGDDALCTLLLNGLKPMLKAPLTAVLCSRQELSILVNDSGEYSITGYVNSQNSYGAMIKTNFRASAVQVNGQWQLRQIRLENQLGKNLAANWLIGILITIVTFALFYFLYSSVF